MLFTTVRRFFSELQRRRVSRVMVVYVLVAWALLQLGDIVVEPLQLPEWTMSLLIVLLTLGLPVAAILAWALEITPEGIRRTEALSGPDRPSAAPSLMTGRPRRSGQRAAAYTVIGALVAIVGAGSYAFLKDGWGPARAAADMPRFLAVLPFENNSADQADEFFADGVTDDILTHLALVPDFSVVSRTTSMGYKGSDRNVREIAEELGVQYVLEGTVQRTADKVRIRARLVDGRADRNVWVDSYDHDLEDVFAVQTQIARAIADALEVQLSGEVVSRIERRPTEDMGAYELFLLGRESFYRYDFEGTVQSMTLFERALVRDPSFTLARAWLARSLVIYSYNHGLGAALADSAVAVARQAVAEQPELPDAYTALGSALAISGQYEEAVANLERALRLNPSDWAAIGNLGVSYAQRGSWDKAIHASSRALVLEGARLTSPLHSNQGWNWLQLGFPDRAQAAIEPALTLQPDNPYALGILGWIHILRGERDAAVMVAERLIRLGLDAQAAGARGMRVAVGLLVYAGEFEDARRAAQSVYAQSETANMEWISFSVLYAYALARTDRVEQAHRVLVDAERHARERMEAGDEARAHRYSLAAIHAMRGEPDEAFRWLDEAIDLGSNVAAMTALDPLLASLRGDPRFQSALDRMERAQAPMRTRAERIGL